MKDLKHLGRAKLLPQHTPDIPWGQLIFWAVVTVVGLNLIGWACTRTFGFNPLTTLPY